MTTRPQFRAGYDAHPIQVRQAFAPGGDIERVALLRVQGTDVIVRTAAGERTLWSQRTANLAVGRWVPHLEGGWLAFFSEAKGVLGVLIGPPDAEVPAGLGLLTDVAELRDGAAVAVLTTDADWSLAVCSVRRADDPWLVEADSPVDAAPDRAAPVRPASPPDDPHDQAIDEGDFGLSSFHSDSDGWLHLFAPDTARHPERWRVELVGSDGTCKDVTATGEPCKAALFWPGRPPDGRWCWLVDRTPAPEWIEIHIPGRPDPVRLASSRRRS